jgi:hypothetical protein
MLKFRIEQLAICPPDPIAAIALLTAMGAGEFARDHVVANGRVFGVPSRNEADLAFDYELMDGAREFEVLNYTVGDDWMSRRQSLIGPTRFRASHLGMHCTAEELDEWRGFFADRGIAVVQEVDTESHTNPVIAGKRSYTYAIFDTFPILGIDVKFIVRHDVGEDGQSATAAEPVGEAAKKAAKAAKAAALAKDKAAEAVAAAKTEG